MDGEADSRHLIEVKQAGTNGQGTFATAAIPRGTRVLAESGLLQIDRAHTSAKDIIRAFLSSPEDGRRSYLTLHRYAHPHFHRAAEQELGQKWPTISPLNRQVLEIWEADTFGDVFLLGSRFNHSCVPNINFAWNTNLGKETFHAVRDIAAGEELTVMYINGVSRKRKQRQGELARRGFTCACPACDTAAPDFQAKEAIRGSLYIHDQSLAISTRQKNWKLVLNSAQTLAGTQSPEGFLVRELSRSYHDAARACVMLGQTKMALLWAEKELESDRYCVGEDHPDYPEELDFVQKLRTAVERKEPVGQSVIDWLDAQDG